MPPTTLNSEEPDKGALPLSNTKWESPLIMDDFIPLLGVL